MMPLPRLLITVASILLLIVIGRECIVGRTAQPRLNLEATWGQHGMTVTWVRPAGRAWVDGIRPGARVISIDGHPPTPADTVADATRVEVSYRGEIRQTALLPVEAVISERLTTLLTLAGCFAAIAHINFLIVRKRIWAWMVFIICMSAAYALIAAVPLYVGTPLWAFNLVSLSLIVFCTACLLFFLVFPVNQMEFPERKYLGIASVGTSVIFVLIYLYVVAYSQASYDLFRYCLHASYLINLTGACVLGIRSLWQCRYQPHLARAIAIVWIGLFFGVMPFCVLVLLPGIILGRYLLSPYLVINSIALFAFALLGAVTLLETYYAEERGAVYLWEEAMAAFRAQKQLKSQANTNGDPPAPEDEAR